MANKLKLNPDKTEILLIQGMMDQLGRKFTWPGRAYTALKDQVLTLGVLLDTPFSMEAQIFRMARSAFWQLLLITQVCPYLDRKC